VAGRHGSLATCARPTTANARPATDRSCRQIQSIVSTGSGTGPAKAAGVDVERYLEDLLYRIDDPQAGGVEKMTPWAWADERRREAADLNG